MLRLAWMLMSFAAELERRSLQFVGTVGMSADWSLLLEEVESGYRFL
jgi:hypothetical protein